MDEPTTVFSTGDQGDIIATLPAARALGRCRYLIGWKPQGARETMRGSRFLAIKPLLEVQPYIESVAWTEALPAYNWKDFSSFRNRYQPHRNLAVQQAEAIGVQISLDPWLTIPNPTQHNRPVIARTHRYHNSLFPWRKLLSVFTSPIFVGLPNEHKTFTDSYSDAEFVETKDMLELARVIAGASIVLSNQTAAWWIAAGIGKPTIQESYLTDLNSVIERPNLFYSRSASEINDLLWKFTSKPSHTEKCVIEPAAIGLSIQTAPSRSG